MAIHPEQHIAWKLMGEIGFCMFVTGDGANGGMRARPMSAHAMPVEGVICFLTGAKQRKDFEISANSNVCLAFADPGSHKYVSVSGSATINNDRGTIASLWSPAASVWWADKNDPDIRVIRVLPSSAEYWEGAGAVVTFVKMAAAVLTGERPDLGAHKKVAM